MKKVLCLLLVLTLALVGGAASAAKLTEEPVTITYMRPENNAIPVQENTPTNRAIEELTGVKLKITAVSTVDYPTRMTALYAADDLPDIFEPFNMTKREMVEDGAVLRLTDLLKEYAPHVMAYYERYPDLYRTMVDGEIYSLPQIRVDENLEAGCVPFLRVDLLEQSGLAAPQTWDELYDTLDALCRQYGVGGWSARGTGRVIGKADYAWLDSFGASFGYYKDDAGAWRLGMIEKEYKDAIEYLRKLVDGGLIDPEYLTTSTSEWQEKLASGNFIFWYDNPTFATGINTSLSIANPDARFAPLPLLKNPYGKVFSYKQPTNYLDVYYVSSDTKDPALMARFLDWCYSDEGAITFGYGREGETYYFDEQGAPQWLDSVLQHYKNAEDAYYQASSDMGVNNGYFCPAWLNLTIEPFRGASEGDVTAQYIYDFYYDDLHDGTIVEKAVLPPLTEAQDARIQEIKQNIWDYAETEFTKFMMGTRDMAEYDGFIEELVRLGAKEWAEILNEAEAAYQQMIA